jgi:hypothetical protein
MELLSYFLQVRFLGLEKSCIKWISHLVEFCNEWIRTKWTTRGSPISSAWNSWKLTVCTLYKVMANWFRTMKVAKNVVQSSMLTKSQMGFKKFQKDFRTPLTGDRRPPGQAWASGQARAQARYQARARHNIGFISLISQPPYLPWFKFQHCQNLLDKHTVG